ncbi:MAG TPA: hypothetical protein VFQ89_03140, partial [Candidatus Binatia bacterium]|nr:hypothetical protein [Candidatus Binatia bacterium]
RPAQTGAGCGNRRDAEVRVLRSRQAAQLAAGIAKSPLSACESAVFASSSGFLDTPPNDA